ncbi:hypothetical protein HS088_TW03G01127 [Tripterygium wilfordii]|uniref:Uncharacterized protein n=2 Tax=Tripterygium wilfordii TaxID=458696 RepID=A0A7J7DWT7_TRIWF|nr:hypothetical protein HS088_TW03G01127 [Tripterygium wilfordii]
MERWRNGLCFKRWFHFPTKNPVLKVMTSHIRRRNKGDRNGLKGLYKDMKSCGEYADIQVMWEIIHSSSPAYADNTTTKRSRRRMTKWRFCFRPT